MIVVEYFYAHCNAHFVISQHLKKKISFLPSKKSNRKIYRNAFKMNLFVKGSLLSFLVMADARILEF